MVPKIKWERLSNGTYLYAISDGDIVARIKPDWSKRRYSVEIRSSVTGKGLYLKRRKQDNYPGEWSLQTAKLKAERQI